MSGYFTRWRDIRGQTLESLETRLGYRTGRLVAKGAWVYRFERLPTVEEFEVRGTTIWTEQSWKRDVAPQRQAQLAAEAAYHRATKVPTFDEQQRRNARAEMSVDGDKMLVKVVPVDFQPIDKEPEGYRHGSGIGQWRLTDDTVERGAIHGVLLFEVPAHGQAPWRL